MRKYIINILFLTTCVYAGQNRLKTIHVEDTKASVDSAKKTLTKKRGCDTLGDYLKQENGIHFIQYGGVAGLSSLTIRGGNSNQVAILKDGSNAANTVDMATDFSSHYGGGDKISVVKGPVAAKYGSNALMGAVIVDTQDPIFQNKHTTILELGTQNHQKTLYVYENANENGGIIGRLNQQSKNGPPITPLHLRSSYASHQNESKSQFGGDITATYTPNDRWYFKTHVSSQRTQSEYFETWPTPHTTQGTIQHNTISFDLKNTDPQKIWRPAFFISHNIFKRRDAEKQSAVQNHHDNSSTATNIQLNNAFHYENHVLFLNGDVRFEDLYQNKNAHYHIVRPSCALGGQYIWNKTHESEAWYRYNDGKTSPYHDMYVQHRIKFGPMTVFGVVGLAHRAPSLMQLYHALSGNAALAPEKNIGVALGYQWKRKKFSIKQTLFRNIISNMITNAPTAPYKNENIQKALTYGVETDGYLHINDVLGIYMGHTYLNARNTMTGDVLMRQPRHKWHYGVSCAHDQWRLKIHAMTINQQKDYDPEHNIVRWRGGHTTLHLTGEYTLNKRVLFYTKIDNMLSKRYTSPLGYEHPRFAVLMGTRIRL